MGNYISRRTCDITGKVILPDGTIKVFEQPVAVGELMLEHQQQFVVEFGPLVSGKKLLPLPADHKLETEKVYLMLPMRRGKGVKLSTEEARQILHKARIVAGSGYFLPALRILPFGRLCSASIAEKEVKTIRTRRDGGMEEQAEEPDGSTLMSGSMEGRPEFLSRKLSGRCWKPSLQTIKEKAAEKKVPYWLF